MIHPSIISGNGVAWLGIFNAARALERKNRNTCGAKKPFF
jgi:hypothetical protein